MNELRIQQAATLIAKRRLALAWLVEYGKSLDGRDKEAATVEVRLHFAGSCNGSNEAQELLSSYARFQFPEIVKASIECCRNDIAIETDAIRREIDKVTVCDHAWHIWPETDGQEQKCAKCGAYRKTPA